MKLFVDLDGTLVDFQKGYFELTGINIGRGDVNWKQINAHPKGFFRSLEPMPYFDQFWKALQPYKPTILSGTPDLIQVKDAKEQKRDAIDKLCGKDTPLICCPSKKKYLHAQPGYIIIDDWEKYMRLWLDAGGTWITHVHWQQSVSELDFYWRL